MRRRGLWPSTRRPPTRRRALQWSLRRGVARRWPSAEDDAIRERTVHHSRARRRWKLLDSRSRSAVRTRTRALACVPAPLLRRPRSWSGRRFHAGRPASSGTQPHNCGQSCRERAWSFCGIGLPVSTHCRPQIDDCCLDSLQLHLLEHGTASGGTQSHHTRHRRRERQARVLLSMYHCNPQVLDRFPGRPQHLNVGQCGTQAVRGYHLHL